MQEVDGLIRALENQARLLEVSLTSLSQVVSYDDELWDRKTGEIWTKVGVTDMSNAAASLVYTNELKLEQVRNLSRYLSSENPFAINAIENRISYVVGQGHVYDWEARPDMEEVEVDDLLESDVTDWTKDFIEANGWHSRQQEMLRRFDRDGEVFTRYFERDGMLLVRFVEPEQIRTPLKYQSDPTVRFGIKFADKDAETAVAYFVHSSATAEEAEEVPADQIQHRKANVDCTAPRGVPLLWPVRQGLVRADKLLRNMGHLAAIRASIAIIRKHASGSKAAIEAYVSKLAAAKVSDESGNEQTYQDFRPGSIIDKGTASDWEFPSHQTDVGSFVEVLQAELRAVASRLVMPEFMLTSDASNANYSSTMVAEGPAVKMFERLQASVFEADKRVIEKGVATAEANGRLRPGVLEQLRLTAEFPRVQTRDRLKEAQADRILVDAKAMSRHTMAGRHGLDYDDERRLMDEEAEAGMERMPNFGGGGSPFGGGADEDGQGDEQEDGEGDISPDDSGEE